jgi:hypothetical protein
LVRNDRRRADSDSAGRVDRSGTALFCVGLERD